MSAFLLFPKSMLKDALHQFYTPNSELFLIFFCPLKETLIGFYFSTVPAD